MKIIKDCNKEYCNISTEESYFRYLLSIILLTFAFTYSFVLSILSLYLFLSAFTKFCLFYKLLLKKKKIELESIYLDYLPKFSPEPVIIVDSNGNPVFKNEPAKKNLNIKNIKELTDNILPSQIIDDEKIFSIKYKTTNNKHFYIKFLGMKKIDYIFIYADDITELIDAESEIIRIQKEIVYKMGEIGESRSKETGQHVRRVANYSKLLALKSGLSNKEADLLKLASPMHDIGKVAIPDSILNKTGKLSDEERSTMETHSTIGYNLLKDSDKEILRTAAIVAYEHHEKWDGTGYPNKKKGDEIHIYGRITALADVFDALGSDRVYKKAWSDERIFELLKKERGKHFDPNLVDLFFENFKEINLIRKKFRDK